MARRRAAGALLPPLAAVRTQPWTPCLVSPSFLPSFLSRALPFHHFPPLPTFLPTHLTTPSHLLTCFLPPITTTHKYLLRPPSHHPSSFSLAQLLLSRLYAVPVVVVDTFVSLISPRLSSAPVSLSKCCSSSSSYSSTASSCTSPATPGYSTRLGHPLVAPGPRVRDPIH
ncbi:hypothetical protein FJTKL_05327 [Diaporthe vaccinii]|uniref:Uncharacterized protein n=1 Tax=Diaporthe vaccinii TaxID=105482 RepID=A0ABR4FFE6_9PEZI